MKHSILSTVMFLLLSQTGFCGGNVENGGDGAFVNGKLYSLDLVEYGLEQSPWTSDSTSPSKETVQKAEQFFSEISPEVLSIILHKLGRIEEVNLSLSKPVTEILTKYSLIFVDAPLKPIGDADSPISPAVIYQIATHDDQVIRVNRSGYGQLATSANKAAVLVHELLYASFDSDMTSIRSRSINSFLFNPRYGADSLQDRYLLAQTFSFEKLKTLSPQEEIVMLEATNLVPNLWKNSLDIDNLEFKEAFRSGTIAGITWSAGYSRYQWPESNLFESYSGIFLLLNNNGGFIPYTTTNAGIGRWSFDGGQVSPDNPFPNPGADRFGSFAWSNGTVEGHYSGLFATNLAIQIRKMGAVNIAGFEMPTTVYVSKFTWTDYQGVEQVGYGFLHR
jgi:hypothetical protein